MQKLAGGNRKEYLAGGLMVVTGLGAMARGMSYNVGTLTAMGPGFFPVALGVLMAVIGAAIMVVTRLSTPREKEARLPPEWKAWACILAGIAAFVVVGKYGGLVPATLAVVFISAMGDRGNTWKSALTLAVSMTVLAVVVFWWALQLQFPLFSWG